MGLFALPGSAATTPVPGTLNYIEGQVSIDGRKLTSPNSARVDLNQTLATAQGKAEILLTPGVFLRLGDNSALRMVSPGLTNTEVQILRGEAILEAEQLYKENDIRVLLDGSATTIQSHGLYDFNADQGQIRVFDGKAAVISQDQQVELKKGREAFLGGPLKSQKFDRKNARDPLYAWSNLRSEYEAQASAQAAGTVIVGGPGWYGAGWYWSPYWDMWGFVPGAGILYSPFGWPFYSPGLIYGAYGVPFHYGGRYYGTRFVGRQPAAAFGARSAPGFRGGLLREPALGSMGPRGFGGGGFRGGAVRR